MELETIYARYLGGRATGEEIRYLLRCFNDPARQAEVAAMVDYHLAAGTRRQAGTETELDEAVREIYTLLQVKIRKERPVRWLRLAGAAAAVLLLGVLAAVLWLRPVRTEYSIAGAGERKLIRLADGSKVWLSPSSSLRYPDQFNGSSREVRLAGEAFFDVAKDKKHPFIIYSAKLTTRVVGTSFMIGSSGVTVVTGIVRVTCPANTVTVRPGQWAAWKNGRLEPENYPAGQVLARRDGILTYDGAPLREVAADLSRYYNIPVIPERPSGILCYGAFDTNKPLAVVLEQLSAATGAGISFRGGKYFIRD